MTHDDLMQKLVDGNEAWRLPVGGMLGLTYFFNEIYALRPPTAVVIHQGKNVENVEVIMDVFFGEEHPTPFYIGVDRGFDERFRVAIVGNGFNNHTTTFASDAFDEGRINHVIQVIKEKMALVPDAQKPL